MKELKPKNKGGRPTNAVKAARSEKAKRGRPSIYEKFTKGEFSTEKLVKNTRGEIEIYDKNNQLVAVQMPSARMVRLAEQEGVSVDEIRTRYVERRRVENLKALYRRNKGLPPDAYVDIEGEDFVSQYGEMLRDGLTPYSDEIAQEIARQYSAGKPLYKILGTAPFPSRVSYSRWLAKKPDFAALMEKARQDRADYLMEKVEAIADMTDGSNAKAMKVKIDAYAKLAATANPDRYGSRTKITGDANNPVAFTVVSRIPDPEDAPGLPALEDKP